MSLKVSRMGEVFRVLVGHDVHGHRVISSPCKSPTIPTIAANCTEGQRAGRAGRAGLAHSGERDTAGRRTVVGAVSKTYVVRDGHRFRGTGVCRATDR